MQTISKSKLKAHMLRVFREIEASGEELIVTDRDRPVIRIQPIASKKSVEEMFGEFSGQLIFHEDPDAPTIDEWTEV
ncbi:MAG: prevent-host-death protein [Chloroflexi bacterium]|nr:prevent-host-death protein [Chloroflexota bacterium]